MTRRIDRGARPARPAPPPTGRGGRIAGLDVARGLAVLGMFAAHLGIGAELAADPATWPAVVDGRSSILFATLAGLSIALLSGRSEPVDGVDLVRARLRIAVRAAWVFAIGGVLEWLDTFVAIILGVYAVLFVLALPFLRWSPRRLLVAAGAIALVGPVLDLLLGQLLTGAGMQPHYFARLMVTGPYPALLWWAFVLLGLAVGRLDLSTPAVRARLALGGAAAVLLGYGAGWLSTELLAGGAPSRGPEAGFGSPLGSWDAAWLSGAAPHSGTSAELVGSAGVAVLVIALCLVLADRLPALTAPVGAVGALALSVYTTHIVAIRALMEIDPFGVQGAGLWLLFASAALLGTTLWQATLGRGPLERLLSWSSGRAAHVPPSPPAG